MSNDASLYASEFSFFVKVDRVQSSHDITHDSAGQSTNTTVTHSLRNRRR